MNRKRAQLCVVCSVALTCAQLVVAQTATSTTPSAGKQATEAGMMTRAQWLKKIGDAAKDASVDKKDAEVTKEVMKQVAAGEKVEFTQRLIKAITRMPLSPEEKQAALNKAAIACILITSLQNDERYKVIAETIAVVPIEYEPGLVGTLSKRFNPKFNNLTAAQFKAMAETTVKLSLERNKATDDPAVRNTFTILLFLMATTPEETPDLQAFLLALLPDDRSRELSKDWIAEALKGNFEPLLTAADVDVRVQTPEIGVQRVGVAQMEQLLAEIGGLTGSFATAARRDIADSGVYGSGIFLLKDVGIQTVPIAGPYPNQLDRLP